MEGQELTQKKSYSRYFIILQEDEKGYALASDKLPSGYAKLEIKNDKCKISYYVQNLKKESSPYHMVLICNKKDVKKILKVAELNIDDHGRAEVSYEYPVENVAGCGMNVDKVVGAAIVKFMNSNIIPVMSGFASTEIPDWKSFALVEADQKRNENKMEAKVEEKKVEKMEANIEKAKEEPVNIFDEYERKIEEVKEVETKVINQETEKVDEEAPIFEEIPMEELDFMDDQPVEVINEEVEAEEGDFEIDTDRNKKKKSKDDCCEIKIEIEECDNNKHHKQEADNNCHDNNKHHEHHSGTVGAFFKELAEGFEQIEGVCEEIKRCMWYKIPVHTPEDMAYCPDYNKHTVVYYPMMSYYPYIKKHGHFIFGYKHDKNDKLKYLVYGIPGTKSRKDQPYGGRSGFVTWVPMTPGDEEEHSYGYWLMFYDFRTSTIVIPVK